MAIAKMKENWVGKKRTQNNVTIESCYSLYADMANASTTPYLCLNNFSVYANTKSPIANMLPLKISIRINSGTTYTFTSDSYPSMSGNSPSSAWMAYYVCVSSNTHIPIPGNATAFTINVTVKPASGNTITFTEAACGPSSNTVTSASNLLYTGKVYTFNCANNVPVGTNFTNSTKLYWDPLAHYNGNIIFSNSAAININGYVDAYTTTTNASAAFNKFYFALHNAAGLNNDAQFRENASITLTVRYKSADFQNGIMITYCSMTVLAQPRYEIDAGLKPEINASGYTVTATPSNTVINGKYIDKKTQLTLKATGKFKYGDSLVPGSNTSTFYATTSGGSPSDLQRQEKYFVYVQGQKWGEAAYNANTAFTCTVLFYEEPKLVSHAMHRCRVVSSDDGSGKCYTYGGTVYKLDDEGGNCLIEYSVKFTPLDNTNTKKLVITYSSGSKTITPSSYTASGFIVVPANTESAMDVTFKLYDKFYTSGLDAGTYRLSTAGVIMDFLNGGRGIGIGKVAEERNCLDINPNWTLMLYKATVGDYSAGTAKNLVSWMKDIDNRLATLERNS